MLALINDIEALAIEAYLELLSDDNTNVAYQSYLEGRVNGLTTAYATVSNQTYKDAADAIKRQTVEIYRNLLV